jgi:hypothetical protein
LHPAEEPPRVEMVYLQPPQPETPTPPLRQERRVPVPPQRKQPEPEPNAPPEATRSTGSEVDDPTPLAAAPSSKQPVAEKPASPAAAEAATMESEARRIFGRPRVSTAAGAGPQAVRPMESYIPNDPERCVPHQPVPRDSAGPVQLGTVIGRIYRQNDGLPLAGAHLQMIGTPFVTFTDSRGEYRFRFDLSLVDNCRTQYVRVTAAGYESRLLVLTVGPDARSEDVRLRHR